ncbi:hypothetical protein [Flavobacterium sp.]|uniref:hypothetical protein n=1 Tax=Flavobacterium sp. TaxID=239 RepID=UPI0025E7AA00|nr:hypothetical protein [Flavobacterium sp.]
MKKIVLCLGLVTVLIVSSCGKKEEQQTETTTTETTTTEAPAPNNDTIVVKHEAPKEGTSVKIDKNGVEMNSKDVDVNIKK